MLTKHLSAIRTWLVIVIYDEFAMIMVVSVVMMMNNQANYISVSL